MAWTYSGNPLASDRDWVRFQIQDTEQADPLFSDEEIDAVLAETGNRLLAAAKLAEVAARRFARQATYSIEGMREDLSERARVYAEMAARLRAQAARGAVPVFTGNAGGPVIRRGVHDNPEARGDGCAG